MTDIQEYQGVGREFFNEYVDLLLAEIKDIAEQFLVASRAEDAEYIAQLRIRMGQDLADLADLLESGDVDEELLAQIKGVLCDDVIMKWLSFLGVEGDVLTKAVSLGASDFREASGSIICNDAQALKDGNPFLSKLVFSHLIAAVRKQMMRALHKRATAAPLIGEFEFMQQSYDLSSRLRRYFFPDSRRADDREIMSGKKGFAILFIDLDKFKLWNDTLSSHKYGDAVLRVVARCISQALRPTDIKIRKGGEEFVIVLDEIRNKDDALKKAAGLCRLVAGLKKEDFRGELPDCDIDNIDQIRDARGNLGLSGYASLSIGVVTFFHDDNSREDDGSSLLQGLIGMADDFAFRVKNNGRNGVAFLDEDERVKIRRANESSVVDVGAFGGER